MNKVAITVAAAPDSWQAPDWQRLWLAICEQKKRWRSLALLPAGSGASPEAINQIAVTLAHTGMVHVGAPIHVADGTRVTLDQLVPFSEGMASHMAHGELMILSLSAVSDNVTSLSLAKAADCVLLCVLMGKMSLADARKTVTQVGPQSFVGTAAFHPATPGTGPRVDVGHAGRNKRR